MSVGCHSQMYCREMSDLNSTFEPKARSVLRRHNLMLPLLRALVTEEAIGSVQIDHSVRETLYAQWHGDRSLEEASASAYEKLGWSNEDLDWQLLKPARLTFVARERFGAKAEAHFLQKKNQLDQVVYSLVRCKDVALARELYLRLAAGEANFAELAQKYSEGPERFTQGVIGPNPLSNAHPQLAEHLRTARDGEVIAPFLVAEWCLIARRDQLISAQFNEEMAERMALELFQEWVQNEAQLRLEALNILL